MHAHVLSIVTLCRRTNLLLVGGFFYLFFNFNAGGDQGSDRPVTVLAQDFVEAGNQNHCRYEAPRSSLHSLTASQNP